MTSRIYLKAGPMALDLAPEIGGAIAGLRFGNIDLMRPIGGESPREASCFAMVPFSGRIADGKFSYAGEDYTLPLNMPGQPHAIHGDAWLAPWTVLGISEDAATFVYRHDGSSGWPFRYSVVQAFNLFEDGLEVRMTLINEDVRSFPGGFGFHPYFPLGDAELTTRLPLVWLMDDRKIPIEREPTPDAWDFTSPRKVAGAGLDHCFADWDGEASIRWPSKGITLQITADGTFEHCVVYVPDGKDYFCVEPVSHRNDAVNQTHDDPATGLVDLEPGEALTGRMIFTVEQE